MKSDLSPKVLSIEFRKVI